MGRIVVESVTANTFVGVQQGTITVDSWNLTPGKYYLVDDSGTGILAEYDPAIAYPISNPVMQALTSTIGHVLPWRPSVGAIVMEVPVQVTQGNLTPSASNGNYSATGITMEYTPYRDGSINVVVNGVSVNEGATAFTLILGANSAASDRVRPSIAPLDDDTKEWKL